MATFKVGDRVWITRRVSSLFGREGTIWAASPWQPKDNGVTECGYKVGDMAYSVDVDGLGTHFKNYEIAFSDYDLIPLVNPDELAWQAFKTQHLTPDPILAKEVA